MVTHQLGRIHQWLQGRSRTVAEEVQACSVWLPPWACLLRWYRTSNQTVCNINCISLYIWTCFMHQVHWTKLWIFGSYLILIYNWRSEPYMTLQIYGNICTRPLKESTEFDITKCLPFDVMLTLFEGVASHHINHFPLNRVDKPAGFPSKSQPYHQLSWLL